MDWSELIGKKIVAFRGFPQKRSNYSKTKVTPLSSILFDDNETFIELDEQDPYTYHDCSSMARDLNLRKDADLWKRLFNKEGRDEPDNLKYPF